MELWEQEFYICQIMSGVQRITVDGRTFLLKGVSAADKAFAHSLLKRYRDSCAKEGIITQEELYETLIRKAYWSTQEELQLLKVKDDIENDCVDLFNFYFQSDTQKKVRAKLDDHRELEARLMQKKHEYDYLSLEYISSSAKVRYLVGAGLYYEGGKKYWKDYRRWDKPDGRLDRIIAQLNQQIIPFPYFRKLARSDYWRPIWSSRKACTSLFGGTAIDLTENQKMLIYWSNLFDNIAQSPDCPPDVIIEDDDVFDGWCIIQRRKQELEANQKLGKSKITNEKIANAGSQFIKADNMQDARKIIQMNTPDANSVRKARLKQLNHFGEVREVDMVDTRQEIAMQANSLTRGK